MNILESFIFFILFLINKYIDCKITEKWLIFFENRMIRKYVSRKEIDPIEIPTIQAENLTNELFLKLSDNYRNPVMIKGFMKNSQAVKNWNLSYLNDIIGDFKINTISYDSELDIQEMTFNEFTKRHEEGIYINNNHTILSHFPKLFNDIKDRFDHLIKTLYSTNLKNIHIANLFIGSTQGVTASTQGVTASSNDNKKITGSNMHAGGSGNFFCQLVGKKTWTLIDPKFSCLLKGRVASNGIHAQTLFDMPDTDINTYPTALKHFPRYEITLEPGDILWNAPWHWHRIRNHDGLSIGMAIRNNKVTYLNLRNNLTYTLSGYVYLVYNSFSIALYEKFIGNKHFGASKNEKSQDNVLYQIDKLVKKYPKSVKIETIFN
jgi:hypothetical protein